MQFEQTRTALSLTLPVIRRLCNQGISSASAGRIPLTRLTHLTLVEMHYAASMNQLPQLKKLFKDDIVCYALLGRPPFALIRMVRERRINGYFWSYNLASEVVYGVLQDADLVPVKQIHIAGAVRWVYRSPRQPHSGRLNRSWQDRTSSLPESSAAQSQGSSGSIFHSPPLKSVLINRSSSPSLSPAKAFKRVSLPCQLLPTSALYVA